MLNDEVGPHGSPLSAVGNLHEPCTVDSLNSIIRLGSRVCGVLSVACMLDATPPAIRIRRVGYRRPTRAIVQPVDGFHQLLWVCEASAIAAAPDLSRG